MDAMDRKRLARHLRAAARLYEMRRDEFIAHNVSKFDRILADNLESIARRYEELRTEALDFASRLEPS